MVRREALATRKGIRKSMMTALWKDLRFALRMMRRAPGFTATVVLTIAVAIAANATIFTVVNAVRKTTSSTCPALAYRC
jgi:predicted lysophospholipase L1 biosynthesis ABC-type transport system permease subunit